MLRSVLLTALLAFSVSAGAQGFDYNYFSVGYQRLNLDDGFFDVDGDGFGLNGSFAVNEAFSYSLDTEWVSSRSRASRLMLIH